MPEERRAAAAHGMSASIYLDYNATTPVAPEVVEAVWPCHSAEEAISGVLGAMGIPRQRALGAVRLSVGEPTNGDEIARGADALAAAWRALVGGSSGTR